MPLILHAHTPTRVGDAEVHVRRVRADSLMVHVRVGSGEIYGARLDFGSIVELGGSRWRITAIDSAAATGSPTAVACLSEEPGA